MTSANWLVTGVTGLLGANAALELSKSNRVLGVARQRPEDIPIEFVSTDLTKIDEIGRLVEIAKPDVILHCAALSTHEECEKNPELAHQLNVVASKELATKASQVGAKFVYISTDAVFDGEKGNYSEEDQTSPNTEYGRTKLHGEEAVHEGNSESLIARVNFYGWSPSGKRSLAEYFFNRLNSDIEAPGFTDVRVSTMYVSTLVNRIQQLVASGANGIYNVANDEPITKYELGLSIARHMNKDKSLIPPAKSTELLSLPRGNDTSLNTSKLKKQIGISSNQEDDISYFFNDLSKGIRESLKNFV